MLRIGIFGTVFVEDPQAWKRLPTRQQQAVLAHEHGHRHHGHVWKRLIAGLFLSDDAYAALLHRQEFEADAYARAQGHGNALAVALGRTPEHASRTHPATCDRVAKLIL